MIMSGESAYLIECAVICFFSGFAPALLYTVFQMIRVIFSIRRIGTAVMDVLFFAAAAVAAYLAAFAMNEGQLRFFQLAVSLIGFCVFMLTLYPVFMYPTQKLYRFAAGLSGRIHEKIHKHMSEKKRKHKKHAENKKKTANKMKKSKKGLEKLM